MFAHSTSSTGVEIEIDECKIWKTQSTTVEGSSFTDTGFLEAWNEFLESAFSSRWSIGMQPRYCQ